MAEAPRIDDGGPAFPQTLFGWLCGRTGLSLRDWFAGQFLRGLGTICGELYDQGLWTELAYRFADGMILARKMRQERLAR